MGKSLIREQAWINTNTTSAIKKLLVGSSGWELGILAMHIIKFCQSQEERDDRNH